MSEVAIVDTVGIDDVSRDIALAIVAYNDGERALHASETKTASLREQQAQRRLALGRMLIEAKRDIKHGGWLPYLEKLGISARTAQDWMAEAGFIEDAKNAASPNAAHLPSRVAAGIDKRPRKRDEQPDPPPRHDDRDGGDREDEEDDDAPSLHTSWRNDLTKALVGLDKMIMGYAKSWPKRSRSDLAKALRSVAERIERMAGD